MSAATATAATPTGATPQRAPRSLWRSQRFLLLRRLSQALVFALFLLGPWAGVWWIEGNLSSSRVLDTVPLTDPFVLLQVLAAGHVPQFTALAGAAVVVLFYALAGGRAYCAWVCPVNLVTDGAAALRRRLGLSVGRAPSGALRYWVLGAVLLACAATGQAVWEAVNPVSLTQRALIFGGTVAWSAAAAVFALDLLVTPRGWCGGLCPMGATYALIGRAGLLRVSARHASRCNDCGDCFAVCPEPQVIALPLKGKQGAGPVVRDSACTNCGRCIDVCTLDVFAFTHRFDTRRD
jgi:ferredoxin-type protein NapH